MNRAVSIAASKAEKACIVNITICWIAHHFCRSGSCRLPSHWYKQRAPTGHSMRPQNQHKTDTCRCSAGGPVSFYGWIKKSQKLTGDFYFLIPTVSQRMAAASTAISQVLGILVCALRHILRESLGTQVVHQPRRLVLECCVTY